jgi:23S rRNA pseudouridine2605 synthase
MVKSTKSPSDKPRSDKSRSHRPHSDKPRSDKPPHNNKTVSTKSKTENDAAQSERIAKRMARAGLCSRREAERWIEEGRVVVNDQKLTTPAVTVSMRDKIEVDGNPLPAIERTRLWLFHKPAGVMTTNHDPEGRPTIFDVLPKELPRVITVGRLDMNTEGLLLLTNDGGLARVLELPATGWLRRYRVRVHGKVDQAQLDSLREGIAVDGVLYGSIEATIDRQQGTNCWLNIALREGKNREIKRVLAAFDLDVTRLIRLSYGPFQLAEMSPREVREIKGRALRDQLGERLAKEAGANFDAPIIKPLTSNLKGDGSKAVAKSGESNRGKSRTTKRERSDEALTRLDTKPQQRRSAGGGSDWTAPGKVNSKKPRKGSSRSNQTSSTQRGKNADRRR